MSIDDPGQILVMYFCLLFSLCVHEAAHAAMANWCGDPTARLLGRMTLDPRKHIDPLGTVILPLIMMMAPGARYLFGWAKPVPFNTRNLNNFKRDPILIAMAGPFSNIIIALSSALVLRILLLLIVNEVSVPAGDVLIRICEGMILINVILALFNMIPLPPLDGHHVLFYFLSDRAKEMVLRMGPFGIIIAIVAVAPVLSTPIGYCIAFFYGIATYGIIDMQDLG